MSKLTEKAVALLQEGEVNLVIGYEEGNHGTRPLFCRQAENADRLILDDRCTNNIAVYLTKRELTGTGKVAITATVPALRTVVQLAFENQLKEDNLLVLTVDGHGEVIQFKGFDEIKTYLADFPLTISEENLQLIDRLKKMSREERRKCRNASNAMLAGLPVRCVIAAGVLWRSIVRSGYNPGLLR